MDSKYPHVIERKESTARLNLLDGLVAYIINKTLTWIYCLSSLFFGDILLHFDYQLWMVRGLNTALLALSSSLNFGLCEPLIRLCWLDRFLLKILMPLCDFNFSYIVGCFSSSTGKIYRQGDSPNLSPYTYIVLF